MTWVFTIYPGYILNDLGIYYITWVSLSTVVLNSKDRHENLWLPGTKMRLEDNLTTFSFNMLPYNLFVRCNYSAINPSKQLKRALESKLSNFKIFENYSYYSISSESHSLTTTIDLPPKLLGLWPPFFPSTKFISVRTNLCYFRGVYFRLL